MCACSFSKSAMPALNMPCSCMVTPRFQDSALLVSDHFLDSIFLFPFYAELLNCLPQLGSFLFLSFSFFIRPSHLSPEVAC